MPGLNSIGVPKKLLGTTFPFFYNDYETLKKIVLTNNIGTIKMEVTRNSNPQNNFFKKSKKISN